MRWPARWLAALCAVAVTLGGLHLITPAPSQRSDQAARTVSAAQGFADAAAAAFTESAVGSDPALTTEQRRAGLPDAPVAGLTARTAAGPVQVVLPGGLGNAQHTPGGQVVYPNAGAGFDMLAENTASGTRTVARISDPAGPRMVTTFVRTPADTVMLAHTNGYLTINRATPTAETIGMFSPAETRDATGKLVPSSYVVKQLAPQLYALAEVIDPQPGTTWPVYVDPPLHVGTPGAPLPQGFLDSFTNTVSSLADTATSAVTTVASATASGAKAVGTFVKENPLESAMLVGGVALAVTGIGGPAGAAMITAATVNLASATVDIAAAALPDNQALGIASNVLGAASMVTPQGAAKKVVKEGTELAVEQLTKHADDVIDVAKTAPTPPAQLADDVAAAATAKPPVTPGVSPKAPNAPPAAKPTEVPCAGQSFTPDTLVLLADGTNRPISQLRVGDQVWSTDPASGRSGPQTVQAVLVNHDTDLLDLTITNNAGASSVINTTSGHPFYSPNRADSATTALAASTTPANAYGPGWIDAKDLRPGDALYPPNGAAAQVKSTSPVAGDADMWDLTIESTHTFYITTPAVSVLVHNCPMPAPKATPPAPKQPKGGVYVIHDKDMNPVYVGRSRNVDSRLLAHAGPNGKLRAGDSVQVYRTDSRLARRGLEQRLMDHHRTLNPPSRPVPGSLGRNSIRGVRVGHPKTKKFDQAADRFLSSQHRDPDISRLPQRVQRRLDARGQAQRSADTQRATAQSSARDANQPSRSSGSDQSGSSGRSADKQDKDKKKDKKSKQNHQKPNGK
ncbi:polymorphic toxin-type HINT domain-containing protein [Mycolicibacterium houstonense]|uniref:polymorphic toxin-type HINT domain-containing protein n=1 Tax=Mycolicibacterium houstonense TaxID=146021 RepID=UPI0022864DED|nr:polymorphic toxin-type HINT domain-containing protein [Mycolicibacterium houstonense]